MVVYLIIREHTVRGPITGAKVRCTNIDVVDNEAKAVEYLLSQFRDDEKPACVNRWMNYIYKYDGDDPATIRYEPHLVK